MRALVIVPSRGRPSNAARLIDAWYATNAFDVADLLFALDEDDTTLHEYGYAVSGSDSSVDAIVGGRETMVNWTNGLALAKAHKYFALGSQGDDHVPRTQNWAQTYMNTLIEMGTGVVYGDDGLQRSNLCTEWMMTSDIVRAVGAMIPAPVAHLYADNSVMLLAHNAGVLRWIPGVKIEHMHYVNGKSTEDDGYRRVNAPERWRDDGLAFGAWRNGRMAEDVAKVRALL